MLAGLFALLAVLTGVLAASGLARFLHSLAASEPFAYPDLGPLLQLGYCAITAMNAALWASVRLQGLPRWSGVAIAVLWLGLTFGAIPPAGTALLTRALQEHGYTQCRPIGWLDRGLWVRPGKECPR